jgi:apolipoprotein N-acyltransferase
LKKSLRLILLGLFIILTLWLGLTMFSRYRNQELWGHLPLFFFISAWISILLLFWTTYIKTPKALRWLLLSTASGIILSVGFPPLPFTFLMFVGWVPLLLLENEIAEAKSRSFKKQLFPFAYNTFVVWNILTTYWVANTAFVAGIVAIWLNSFFMTVPFLLFHYTKKILPRLSYISFIVYWISFEMLHLNWEISWSWLNLGNAFARFPQWVQWYEFTGIFGGTLWILLANVLIFKLFKQTPSVLNIWKTQKRNLAIIAGILALPVIFSYLRYFEYKEEGKEVEVAVIQPNLEPHYEKFQLPEELQFDRFRRLSEQILTQETDYLLFPETSFNAGNKDELATNFGVDYFRNLMYKYPKTKLVTGVVAYKVFKEGEPLTRSTRIQLIGSDTMYWEAYNAAIQIENGSDSIPFYIKSKLVPGAEILPYHEVFFFLKPLVESLDGSVAGHGSQSLRESFESNSGRIAPVICYESVFGDYHTGYINQGKAQAIFIMTNDGWWDNTAGHKQHLQFACLRAIETRRSIARSANTGISCFINQRGDILQPTNYGEETAIRGKIPFSDRVTFYTKWGDLIGRIAVFTAALIFLSTFVRGYLHKKKSIA